MVRISSIAFEAGCKEEKFVVGWITIIRRKSLGEDRFPEISSRHDNGLGLPYPQYDDYKTIGYEQFTDWPNLTLKLAERGFNEEELRKILGLNYLRVFKEIVG